MDDKLRDILHRVYELYNRFGIKSITMDDVARELGISKKTVYQYVKDKADLVEKVMVMHALKHAKAMEEITHRQENAVVELLEVNVYMNKMMRDHNPTLDYDLKKYYPAIYHKLMKETKQRMFAAIRKNLEKGQKEGIYRQEMNIEVICKLHMTRMEYSHQTDAFAPEESFAADEFTSPAVIKEIFIYHLHGIANEKGLQVLNEKLKEYIHAD